MKNKLLVVIMVMMAGAVAAEAREKSNDRTRGEEQRKEAAARERQSRRRCGNEDEEERTRAGAARREPRECREPIIDYGPPVPTYGYLGAPLPYYLPVAPGWGDQIPGRFYPIPIPCRPVYVLPGMP